MRDPERIPIFTNKLLLVWQRYPDLRLGQLVDNLSVVARRDTYVGPDTFNVEDDVLYDALDHVLLHGFQ